VAEAIGEAGMALGDAVVVKGAAEGLGRANNDHDALGAGDGRVDEVALEQHHVNAQQIRVESVSRSHVAPSL